MPFNLITRTLAIHSKVSRYLTIYTYDCSEGLHIALQLHDIMHDVLFAIHIHFFSQALALAASSSAPQGQALV